MGISERHEAEKEALKQKIFDGASKLIIEHGYEKLSIRKLAEEIEYSPAVIYNYFKNKDDIINAITQENYKRIYSELSGINFEGMSPETALKTGLLTFAELILKRREHYRATLLSGTSIIDGKTSDAGASGLLINVLNKGVSSGDFDIENTEYTAYLLTVGIFGIVNIIVLNNLYDENMINSTVNGYVDLIVKGLPKRLYSMIYPQALKMILTEQQR